MKVKLIFTQNHKHWPCTIEQRNNPDLPVPTPQCAYFTKYKQQFRGEEYDAERLFFLYQQNPGYWFGTLGYHQGDTEGITFLSKNGELVYVIFSVHSKREAFIMKPDECKYDNEGYLLGFVAPNSNATYPEPGIHWRIFGVANDITSTYGKIWEVSPLIETNELPRPTLHDQTLTKWQRFCWDCSWKHYVVFALFFVLLLFV